MTESILEYTEKNLIVLDATTGQNAIQQLKEFNDVTDITGIILTKMDGTAKGGIVVAIQAEFGIPVKYIGVGEKIEDLQKFDSNSFVEALFDDSEVDNDDEETSFVGLEMMRMNSSITHQMKLLQKKRLQRKMLTTQKLLKVRQMRAMKLLMRMKKSYLHLSLVKSSNRESVMFSADSDDIFR